MASADIPEISDLSAEQLLVLRTAIDTKLDEVREAYKQQCAALGMICTNDDGKKRKRRTAKHHDAD